MVETYYLRNKDAGFLGNSPIWWAKDGAGYTAYIQNAEIWTEQAAKQMVDEDPSKWEMFKCSEINRRLQVVFDSQDFKRIDEDPKGKPNPWGDKAEYINLKFKPLTLTIKEIQDLAMLVGIGGFDDLDPDTLDSEYTITTCHPEGVKVEETDGPYIKYKYVVYSNEYPEEGISPLGNPI